MKTKLAEKCLAIIEKMLINKKFDEIKFVEEVLKQEIDRNRFRSMSIFIAKNKN